MRQSCLLPVWLEYCWEAYLILRDIFYVFIEESVHMLIFSIIVLYYGLVNSSGGLFVLVDIVEFVLCMI
jgi:hypothetical protein